jgi:hypothetical protein
VSIFVSKLVSKLVSRTISELASRLVFSTYGRLPYSNEILGITAYSLSMVIGTKSFIPTNAQRMKRVHLGTFLKKSPRNAKTINIKKLDIMLNSSNVIKKSFKIQSSL